MTRREPIDCPHCNGGGLVYAIHGEKRIVYDCPKCDGWGWVYTEITDTTTDYNGSYSEREPKR